MHASYYIYFIHVSHYYFQYFNTLTIFLSVSLFSFPFSKKKNLQGRLVDKVMDILNVKYWDSDKNVTCPPISYPVQQSTADGMCIFNAQ